MFAKGVFNLEIKDIYNKVSDIDILTFYFNITKLPCIINSPLRQDNHPSFGLYCSYNGKIYYKDFAKKDVKGGMIDLVSNYYNLTFSETIYKIYKEVVTNTKNVNISYSNKSISNKVNNQKVTNLNVKIREWKDYDFEYWKQYGISYKTLQFCNVFPISNIFKNDNIFTADKYAYVYVEFKDNITSLKIYQPYSKFKWCNNHNSSVWDLWNQLPKKGEYLIITSSRKDAMCIWENTLIPSTSLQGEGYPVKSQVIEELKTRFKNIYILYDNDFDKLENYGHNYGKFLSDTYNLNQIEIPLIYLSKDPSDLYKSLENKNEFKNIINNLIK